MPFRRTTVRLQATTIDEVNPTVVKKNFNMTDVTEHNVDPDAHQHIQNYQRLRTMAPLYRVREVAGSADATAGEVHIDSTTDPNWWTVRIHYQDQEGFDNRTRLRLMEPTGTVLVMYTDEVSQAGFFPYDTIIFDDVNSNLTFVAKPHPNAAAVRANDLAMLSFGLPKDLLELAEIFQPALYGGMRIDTAAAFSNLGSGWQALDIFDEVVPASGTRGVTITLPDRFSFDFEFLLDFTLNGTFEHNSSNQGRSTFVRFWDITDGAAIGAPLIVGTGRNQEATPIIVSDLFDVTTDIVGHDIRLEIGGGDSYTGVDFNFLSLKLLNGGEWRAITDPTGRRT